MTVQNFDNGWNVSVQSDKLQANQSEMKIELKNCSKYLYR